jgi:hypothetical protein
MLRRVIGNRIAQEDTRQISQFEHPRDSGHQRVTFRLRVERRESITDQLKNLGVRAIAVV